jgi:hypothetical protein
MIQASILHEFVYKNPPLAIVDKQQLEDIIEVDTHVKKLMQRFGIENVRGGTYSSETLPDFLIKTLDLELSFSLEYIKKQDSMFLNIDMTKFLNNEETGESELNQIYDDLNSYKSIVNSLNLLSNNGNINRTVLKDIEWVIQKCTVFECELFENGKIENPHLATEDYVRYKNMLFIFKLIYNVFQQQFDKPINFEYMFFMDRPHCLLDSIFYNIQHITPDNQCFSLITTLLQKYEYMAYSIINKYEEYEFDLTTYPENFLKIAEYKINLLKIT